LLAACDDAGSKPGGEVELPVILMMAGSFCL